MTEFQGHTLSTDCWCEPTMEKVEADPWKRPGETFWQWISPVVYALAIAAVVIGAGLWMSWNV